ncbi:YpzG family protein [Aquibacillus rhizosphaerae]|uniref:YpzG family protein n=1 Tax=Aquibacillus rhizosphaerae TaxID=3051431 RepID=A0ABT7L7N4_9BACI|nr:YpzG family protein [Aquibacillus sp. LR5S19]MDL4841868.1 YpzG family protein [Aquibacillus sp. LR5S19]
MSKHKPFYANLYQDPFQNPRASRKHTGHQVNGETKKSQNEIITEVQTNKRG